MSLRTPSSSPRAAGRVSVRSVGVAIMAVALGSFALGVTPSRGRSMPVASAAKGPAIVTATKLPTSSSKPFSRAGTIVSAASLGIRVFVSAKDGFALANLSTGGGVTYPAVTVDAGRTWRIAGPELWVAAANAPNVLTQVGAASPRTYFTYGGPQGGNSVAVSSDAGRHWYRAYLAGAVPAVVADNGTLIAWTNLSGVYYSKDGGRHWHYASSIFRVP